MLIQITVAITATLIRHNSPKAMIWMILVAVVPVRFIGLCMFDRVYYDCVIQFHV
jgi:hypothetical protein